MESDPIKLESQIPLSESITACCFTPDGSKIYFGDSKGNVTLYCLGDAVHLTKTVLKFDPERVISIDTSNDRICVIGDNIATLQNHSTFSEDGKCMVQGNFPFLTDGCFTKDGKKLVLAFRDHYEPLMNYGQLSGKSEVMLYNIQEGKLDDSWKVNGTIRHVTVEYLRNMKVYDVVNWLIRLHAKSNPSSDLFLNSEEAVNSNSSRLGFLCETGTYSLDCNHQEDVIVIAAEKLILWYPEKDDIFHLIPYERGTGEKPYCVISGNGDTVVAATLYGHSIGVWNTITKTQTAVLQVSARVITSLSISFDGSKIAAGTCEGTLYLWNMPAADLQKQEQKHSSSIENALTHALLHISDPTSILDEPFLLKHIIPNNIQSPSDLLAAHNLVLFAIRSGVVTKHNVRRFGNKEWFFETNLYLPATKILSDQHDIFEKIFFHAESIGIVKNGFVLKAAREIRLDVAAGVYSIHKIATGLALRVSETERRLDNFEDRFTELKRATEQVHQNTKALFKNQRELQQNISLLSGNLTKLEQYIRKSERRQKYATVAKCILSLIPIVGNLVGNAGYAAFEVIGGMSPEDIVTGGLDIGKELVHIPFGVDLSNFQSLRYAFSGKCLSKLDSSAQQAMVHGVKNSSFQSVDNLQNVLTQYLESEDYKGNEMILVDLGSEHWLTNGFVSRSSSNRREDGQDEFRRKARIHFQYFTRSLPNGAKYLPVDDIAKPLNTVLQECSEYETVDDQKVEDVFFKVADDDEDMVSEEVFVKMVLHIKMIQDEQQKWRKQIDELKERFRSRTRNGLLSLRMACRVLMKFGNDLVEDETITAHQVPCCEEVESALRSYDADKNGSIDEEEFIAAAQGVLSLRE